MRKANYILAVLLSLIPCMPAIADGPSIHILPPELVREAIADNPDFYTLHPPIPCFRTIGHICVTKMHWEWMHSGANRSLQCLQHTSSNMQRPCLIDASPSYAWRPD